MYFDMKKNVSVILSIMLLLISCNDVDIFDTTNPNYLNGEKSVCVKDIIYSWGFDTLDILDCGSYYVVEGDIQINKENLYTIEDTRGYHATLYTPKHSYITIGVDGTTIPQSSLWVTAIQDVIGIYNCYAPTLHLSYAVENPDIVLSKDTLYYNICAMGEFPMENPSSLFGRTIKINSLFYQNIDNYLNHSQKVFLLMHELGHNLGLRHSDCLFNNEYNTAGAVLIPNTPTNDMNSYMKSGTCGNAWIGMPYYDIVALEHLWAYTLKLENCDNDDIRFTTTPYYVSRFLIPQKSGFVFGGWHHVNSVYTPLSYDYAITGDKTLYAHWRTPTTIVKRAEVTSNYFIDFSVQSTWVATLEAIIDRGLNTWGELSGKEGSCATLYKKNNLDVFEEICKIDFKDYILYPYPTGNTMTKSINLVLDPGDYRLSPTITSALGPQNELPSGKHGSVRSSIYW